MKRAGTFLLSFVLLFLVGTLDVYGEEYVVKKGNTVGGSTLDGKFVSAPLYTISGGGEAYCLHPEKKGPSSSGTRYYCSQPAEAYYACAIKNGNDQQTIQYTIKMLSAYHGESSGNIVSGNANINYPGAFRTLASLSESEFRSRVKGDKLLNAYALFNQCKNASGSSYQYNSSSSSSAVGMAIEKIRFDCSGENCTYYGRVINYPNGGDFKNIKWKDSVSKKSGTITSGDISSDGSFKITGLKIDESGCGGVTGTLNYYGYPYDGMNNATALRCYKGAYSDGGGNDGDADGSGSGTTGYQQMILVPDSKAPSGGNDSGLVTGGGNGGLGNQEYPISASSDNCPPAGDECNPEVTGLVGCSPKGEITESEDYNNCILNGSGEDACGSHLFANRQYCQISCKENIEIEFPTSVIPAKRSGTERVENANAVLSGRYFSLNVDMKITGTKICVSAGKGSSSGSNVAPIDYDRFLGDVCGGKTSCNGGWNQAMKDAYDTWQAYQEALDNITSSTSVTPKTYPTACGSGEKVPGADCELKNGKWFCTCNSSCSGTRYETSGSAGSINTGTLSVDVYTEEGCSDGATYESFVNNLTAIRDAAKTEYEDLKSKIGNAITDINYCSTYDDFDYDFNPEGEFTYPESYDVSWTGSSTYSTPEKTASYCSSAATSQGFECAWSQDNTDKISIYNCSGDECSTRESKTVHANKAVKKTIKTGMQWKNSVQFYSKNGTGSITKSYIEGKTVLLPENIYPVSVSTTSGTYEFKIKVSNLGENGKFDYCIDELKGGTEPQLVCPYEVENFIDKVHPCYETPGSNYIIIIDDNGNQKMVKRGSAEALKACCDENGQNCSYGTVDSDVGINYYYKSVSLDNLFPNERTVGSNWSTDVGKKAQEEIESNGENIYLETPDYSYTLTPTQMRKIRDYNDQQEKQDNGYADFNLICDANGENCVSEFLSGDAAGCKNNTCFTDNIN